MKPETLKRITTALFSPFAERCIAYAVMFPVGRFLMHMSWLQMLGLAAMYEVWEWILFPLARRLKDRIVRRPAE